MAIDNLPTTTSDESRLSGAYVRSLVKQLTTSKPSNDSSIPREYNQSIVRSKSNQSLVMAKSSNQQNVQGHKKQVRRRLHTSRPYQERLLNMAEARKEIVTALKFHRASMKQANEKKQQLDHYKQPQNNSNFRSQDCEMRIPKSEPSTYTPTNVMVPNLPFFQSYDNNCYPTYVESQTFYENNLNIPLPNQTLGLNLNLQAFANLDTSFCHSINTKSPSNSKYSSLSPSSSSSSTPRDHLVGVTEAGAMGPRGESVNAMMDMHPALDEEEMAEIRSIGEQHQREWDDKVNLVKSARWFKFLKSVEFGKEMKGEESDHYDKYNPNNNDEYSFEEVTEFPPWLSAADQSFLKQHLEDSSTEDTTLPWMDIGDIDAIDDDWLS